MAVDPSSQFVQVPQGPTPSSIPEAVSQQYTPPELENVQPEGEKLSKSSNTTLVVLVVVGLVVLGGVLAYYVGSTMGEKSGQFMGAQQTAPANQNTVDTQIDHESAEINQQLSEIETMQTEIDQGLDDQPEDLSE